MAEPSTLDGSLEIIPQQLGGEELSPVRVRTGEAVSQLKSLIGLQLDPNKRFNLLCDGNILSAETLIADTGLEDGASVTIVICPNALTLQEIDSDSGVRVMLEEAHWKGKTLVLDTVEACAFPGWDICPKRDANFAVEATFKLKIWPHIGYKGTIISQHGSGTGWELRCGGEGVESVFTTSGYGGHNEVTAPLSNATGVWHHACLVFDADTSTVRVFVDGQEAASRIVSGRFLPFCDGNAVVGRNPEWDDRGIIGEIRNASIWPDGLDATLLPSMAATLIAEAQASDETSEHP